MKKYGYTLLALLACGAVYATQDATLTQRQVRDPRQLETYLEANATDAETRIAAVEGASNITLASNKVFIGNGSGKAAPQTISGDIGVTTDAVVSITAGAVVNADVAAAAAIALTKLEAGTASYIVVVNHGTEPAYVDMTGDVTINTNGVTAVASLPAISGALLTALDGANIGSGDIPADRMSTYAALVTEVYGESTITGDAGAAAQLLMTNVIQTVAGDGSTPIADYAVIRAWVSETDMGTASTNNIEALTLSDGSAVETKTADADYIYLTGSAGEATVVIEGTASSLTNYLMISVGPQINSKAIIFVTP